MHRAVAPLDAPRSGSSLTSHENGIGRRKLIRRVVSLLIIVGAVVSTFYVWSVVERHPRTDDAAVRANVIGIVSRIPGPIVRLAVQDNQLVRKGDLLFEIDPTDFETALAQAKANLAKDKATRFRADADERRALKLYHQKVTSTKERDSDVATAESIRANIEADEATVKQAELNLSYTKVVAPFDGRVVNLNISTGAYASVGVPLFSLLDTTKWYVVAYFRERELRHMAPGSPAIVYLVSVPNQRFRGKVQGIGWAVQQEGETNQLSAGVPDVKRELNWVRVAQRFPVRIEGENPDPDLFRMGATAVAIIDGPTTGK